MGLMESIEEDERKLSEELPKEENAVEEVVVPVETEEKPVEAAPEEEPVKEEPKEEKPDDSAYARMRRELAAEKRKREEIEARLNQMQTPQPVKQVEPEAIALPDINKDPIAYVQKLQEKHQKEIDDIRQTQQGFVNKNKEEEFYQQAIQEIQALEGEFIKSAQDYVDVSAHVVNQLAAGYRATDPFMTDAEIGKKVQKRLLEIAGAYARQGLNPVEEIYHLGKEHYGYAPKVEEKVRDDVRKPDLDRIAQNKQRSSNMAVAKGKGTSVVSTVQGAAEMSLSDFARISAEELASIERNG